MTAFVDRLRATFGERLPDVRLFGSKVRGDDHDESDIDVLVLVDRLDWETFVVIHEAADTISGGWISPRAYAFDRYHAPASRASGFYAELRRESVRL